MLRPVRIALTSHGPRSELGVACYAPTVGLAPFGSSRRCAILKYAEIRIYAGNPIALRHSLGWLRSPVSAARIAHGHARLPEPRKPPLQVRLDPHCPHRRAGIYAAGGGSRTYILRQSGKALARRAG